MNPNEILVKLHYASSTSSLLLLSIHLDFMFISLLPLSIQYIVTNEILMKLHYNSSTVPFTAKNFNQRRTKITYDTFDKRKCLTITVHVMLKYADKNINNTINGYQESPEASGDSYYKETIN